jgi:SSS family solute:Na+ symporter
MSVIDWIVLFSTLGFIVAYGTWKTRKNSKMDGYLRGDNEKWSTIGLSVMATQASAITFLSTPGLGFSTGLEFVQFYFAMPIALVILCVTVIPLYYRLNVYTAYEFLEKRFDVKTRLLAAFLFLVQRGLAAGITIYAPSIILSSVLGWDINLTNLLVGSLVIIYTVSGGTKAVSLTQKWQMTVIMGGMFIAFGILMYHIAQYVSFGEAVDVAGAMGKMKVIDLEFDFNDKYNIWTGLTAALFLFLSYFGTDQSQVQRYLGGKSIYESRVGLLFNGIIKVPMQFFILFIGVMVFVLYQFEPQPTHFNHPIVEELRQSEYADDLIEIENQQAANFDARQIVLEDFLEANRGEDEVARQAAMLGLQENEAARIVLHTDVEDLVEKAGIASKSKESDYVFITFVMDYLPIGLVGLLFAVIFSAAMSSTSGELNALASTTLVDYYKRIRNPNATDDHYVKRTKWFTFAWGCLAIVFAYAFSMADSLIEVVNIIGSLFYGTILGIFVVGFYLKRVAGRAVFIGALIAEVLVLTVYMVFIFLPDEPALSYLWLNVIGCVLVMLFSIVAQQFSNEVPKKLLKD